jgi:HAD superfamily hydrolase (TIGR01549 family)
MPQRIKTISFDLWDTIFIDDSDEPKRVALGLAPKPVARRELVASYLAKHEPIPSDQINLAYDVTDAAFRQVWYSQNVTWSVSERLTVLLNGLGRRLPDIEFAELVKFHENMELEVKPDVIPGIQAALQRLHGQYKLAVISDAIFSPGRTLRELLKHYELYNYFDAFVFSDEIGCAKPERRVFEEVARQTNCELHELAHLGDRETKDIAGPHAVGALAILVPIAKDRGGPNTKADAICSNYQDLPEIIKKLST